MLAMVCLHKQVEVHEHTYRHSVEARFVLHRQMIGAINNANAAMSAWLVVQGIHHHWSQLRSRLRQVTDLLMTGCDCCLRQEVL